MPRSAIAVPICGAASSNICPLLAGPAPHARASRAPHALPPLSARQNVVEVTRFLPARCHRVLTDPGTVTRYKATATGLRDLTWHQARGVDHEAVRAVESASQQVLPRIQIVGPALNVSCPPLTISQIIPKGHSLVRNSCALDT